MLVDFVSDLHGSFANFILHTGMLAVFDITVGHASPLEVYRIQVWQSDGGALK